MSDEHSSRAKTESSGYEKLRQTGFSREQAREISRGASEQVHRNQDRIHSDQKPRGR